MKKVLFILSLIIGYSCSSEIPFDKDGAENAVTRSTNDSIYYFPSNSDEANKIVLELGKKSGSLSIQSYKEFNGIVTDLEPEILSKPDWIELEVRHVYYKFYAIMIETNETPTFERTGIIELRQPESNRRLSIEIKQIGSVNSVRVSVEQTYNNRYLFTATSTYPVKGEVRVRVPFEVYNDGGKLDHGALMVIPKGGQTGTYLMDFNASPLVCYHGDLKGYNLFEGSITGDDVYTYEFYRYW